MSDADKPLSELPPPAGEPASFLPRPGAVSAPPPAAPGARPRRKQRLMRAASYAAGGLAVWQMMAHGMGPAAPMFPFTALMYLVPLVAFGTALYWLVVALAKPDVDTAGYYEKKSEQKESREEM